MALLIIDEHHAPPLGGMGGSIHGWERGIDPWHRDAFPNALKDHAPHQGERKSGWSGLDMCGNVIAFILDGSEINTW